MGAEEITRRLKRVEGQVRGLQRMVDEQRDCEAIITQLLAARSALDQVGLMIIDNYAARCLAGGDGEEAQRRMGRVLALIFSRYSVPHLDEQPTLENQTEA